MVMFYIFIVQYYWYAVVFQCNITGIAQRYELTTGNVCIFMTKL